MANTPFLVHRTAYGFYNDDSIEAKIIDDCKRSVGNATKIYHKVDNDGNILSSKIFNDDTQTLDSITTTTEMTLKSKRQRKYCSQKYKITLDTPEITQEEVDELVDIIVKRDLQGKAITQEEKDRITNLRNNSPNLTDLDANLDNVNLPKE